MGWLKERRDKIPGALKRCDGALAIDGVAENMNNTTKKVGADRNVDNLASTLDSVALLDETTLQSRLFHRYDWKR